jgi:hypothetical protein
MLRNRGFLLMRAKKNSNTAEPQLFPFQNKTRISTKGDRLPSMKG